MHEISWFSQSTATRLTKLCVCNYKAGTKEMYISFAWKFNISVAKILLMNISYATVVEL